VPIVVHNYFSDTYNNIIIPTISIIIYDHAAECGVPVSNAKLNYSSTLEGSVLILTCENATSSDEQTVTVICHSNGSWIPDPAEFTCSSFTTALPGSYLLYEEKSMVVTYILTNQTAPYRRWLNHFFTYNIAHCLK
jgi:hypothetical protein